MRIVKVDGSDPEYEALLDMLDRRCFPYDTIEKKTGDWWVAIENDEWIGFVGGKCKHGFYRLLRVGLVVKARGKKYGKRLIRCLLRHARKHGHGEVRTYAHIRNHSSMNTLISCGFKTHDTFVEDDQTFICWKCKL